MNAVIDIGGTNTRISFSSDGKNLFDITRFTTPFSHKDIVKSINDVLKDKQVDKVAIGVAGLVNRNKKRIIVTPNIELHENIFASDIVDHDLDKILVENDAALAGLAESILGQGKDYKKVAYITISTGVGGTLIIDNKLPNTDVNFEPGHIVIEKPEFSSMEDQYDGSFESFCSGISFEDKYKVKPEDCDNLDIWKEYGENLGYGLTDLAILWQPDVIVLGGSISKKSALFLDQTIKTFTKYHTNPAPSIKVSTLDDTNVMLGGLLMLNDPN